MEDIMTKRILISLISVLFMNSSVIATEMVYQFSNPSFSGNGWSSHVLTIENEEYTRQQANIQAQQQAAAAAAAAANNTNLAKFLNNLESRIYATLSQQIASQLFSNQGATSGTFTVAGNTINWSSSGSEVDISITDANGITTQMTVPLGSLAI
jgi:Type VIII secretion system (T8SS), CsgF protein